MGARETLLSWIAEDEAAIIGFLQDFLRAPSPNPPGESRAAATVITRLLDSERLPWRLVAPREEFPNIVGSFEGARPGRRLVLNGHIDVFPVDETEAWTHGPWSGALADGKLWGRGAVDMKAGTAASVMTYRYLHRLRDELCGKLTLTCVSDEETFGPWGARWLMEHEPEVLGDCVLNGEPSSLHTIRFGEKAPWWLRFTIRTPGAHGAYTHLSDSATLAAMRLIADLQTLAGEEIQAPPQIAAAVAASREAADRAMGAGAADNTMRITLNIGVIQGGLKVNMVPGACSFEADFRFPPGGHKDLLLPRLKEIMRRHPSASFEEIQYTEPAACDPDHEMVGLLKKHARTLGGVDPVPVISLGGTDARLWRQRGIPAYVYGPSPRGMGQKDEAVEVSEYLHIVKVHALAALDYLSVPKA